MRRRKTFLVAAAVAAFALDVAACGGGEESQESADENLCEALGNYASAVAGFNGLNLQSSVSDVQDQASDVQSAWESVTSAAQDVGSADTAAIESAQSDLQSAIGGLSGDTTVADGLQQVQPQVQALVQAYQQTFDGLDCASLLTSTTSS